MLKNWSVLILLVAYSGVYLINIACNIGQQVYLKLSEEVSIAVHDHHDHGGHSHEHHSHDVGESSPDKEKDDDCCDDTTPIIFASLSTTTPPTLNTLKVSLPATMFIIPTLQILRLAAPPSNVVGYLNKAPPLKIPDIRIFIQSFLI